MHRRLSSHSCLSRDFCTSFLFHLFVSLFVSQYLPFDFQHSVSGSLVVDHVQRRPCIEDYHPIPASAGILVPVFYFIFLSVSLFVSQYLLFDFQHSVSGSLVVDHVQRRPCIEDYHPIPASAGILVPVFYFIFLSVSLFVFQYLLFDFQHSVSGCLVVDHVQRRPCIEDYHPIPASAGIFVPVFYFIFLSVSLFVFQYLLFDFQHSVSGSLVVDHVQRRPCIEDYHPIPASAGIFVPVFYFIFLSVSLFVFQYLLFDFQHSVSGSLVVDHVQRRPCIEDYHPIPASAGMFVPVFYFIFLSVSLFVFQYLLFDFQHSVSGSLVVDHVQRRPCIEDYHPIPASAGMFVPVFYFIFLSVSLFVFQYLLFDFQHSVSGSLVVDHVQRRPCIEDYHPIPVSEGIFAPVYTFHPLHTPGLRPTIHLEPN